MHVSQNEIDNPAAFKLFYDQYHSKLLGLILYTIGPVPEREETARDLLQDVFLQIWKKRANYDSRKAAPITWISKIAVNICRDHLRSKVRNMFRQQLAVKSYLEQECEDEDICRRLDVRVLLATLEAGEVRMATLRFHYGMSQSQVATVLGIRLSFVKSREVIILKKLRKYLLIPDKRYRDKEINIARA